MRRETEGGGCRCWIEWEEGSYRPLFIVNVSVLEMGITKRTDRQKRH